jgi:hypothetical protein
MLLQKLKTLIKIRFASKVIMFKETLKFNQTISIYYGKQKIIASQQKVLKAQLWAIIKAITSCLNHVVMACVVNQSCGHYQLLDILTTTMTIIIKLQVEMF